MHTMSLEEWGIVFGTLILVLFLILRKKMLKPTAIATGLIAAVFVAGRGGIGSYAAIIVFFLVGEFVTRHIRNKYHRKEHGTRSTSNIVGNIGPAIIALAVNPTPFNVMFFTSLSAAFADTLSSEIGVLSKDRPLLITTLQPVFPGTDGGVSVLGFAAAALGGIIFGILGYALTGSFYWGALLILAGMMGSVLDSVMGAVFQSRGYLDNNLVNFISSFLVGLFFAVLF